MNELTTGKWHEISNRVEAESFANNFSKSGFCPASMRGKPFDVMIAMQMGAEVGMSPTQAVQGIAVINGKPSMYGDALLGVVRASGLLEDFEETLDGGVATCRAKRKGQKTEIVSKFSEADAKRAGLFGKPGPWKTYPDRMLQMRARGFALRDGFADIIKGLITTEEASDYDVKPRKVTGESVDIAPTEVKTEKKKSTKKVQASEKTPEVVNSVDEEHEKLQETLKEFARFGKMITDNSVKADYRDRYKNSRNSLKAMEELLENLKSEPSIIPSAKKDVPVIEAAVEETPVKDAQKKPQFFDEAELVGDTEEGLEIF